VQEARRLQGSLIGTDERPTSCIRACLRARTPGRTSHEHPVLRPTGLTSNVGGEHASDREGGEQEAGDEHRLTPVLFGGGRGGARGISGGQGKHDR
jgi:hypothetical protein